MSDNKERRVKARHDMTQFYQRKNDVSRREMRRGVMIISGDPNPNNSCRSSDNDIEDDTYVSSPQVHPPGKGLASASGSGLGEMMKLRKRLRKGLMMMMMMMVKRKKRYLMWKKSTPLIMLTWDILCLGQPRDKPLSPIRKNFSLLFEMCRSQYVTDVSAQHEMRERRKINISVKKIRTYLNLQPPSFPIAFEGEESLKIESFEERIAHFHEETLVQQWYGDASFNGFRFDYGDMAGASSSHPPPFDSPPSANLQIVEESEDEDDDDE
jgi:hypothetical protein